VDVPSPFDVVTATEKLKRHKTPGIGLIAAKLTTARSEELHQQWRQSLVLTIHKNFRCDHSGGAV
jgi:hypothetical protein